MTAKNQESSANSEAIKSTGDCSCSRAVTGSRPDHPGADEIHPLTRLPKGYRWMSDREVIRDGCRYVKLGSPKWHDVTSTGGEYSVFGFHPMAAPISFENERDVS